MALNRNVPWVDCALWFSLVGWRLGGPGCPGAGTLRVWARGLSGRQQPEGATLLGGPVSKGHSLGGSWVGSGLVPWWQSSWAWRGTVQGSSVWAVPGTVLMQWLGEGGHSPGAPRLALGHGCTNVVTRGGRGTGRVNTLVC